MAGKHSSSSSDRVCQGAELAEGEKRKQFPRGAAKKSSTGFDCEFIIHPQAEFQANCPICLLVLCEPHQVSCCGKSFCQTCIERVEFHKKPCPTCNQQGFTAHANKGLKQSLCAFCVYCSHQKEGCKWTGELGALEKHLNENPQLHEQLVGCEFTEIECHHCCNLFQRRYVTTHQIEECIRRPFSCDYCGNYGADFEDVTAKHWPVCGSRPVPCPNECGVYPERHNQEHHMNRDCPLTVVDCNFHYAGCEVQLPRKDMPAHLAVNMTPHMALLATHNERIVKERDDQITKLREELFSHKHKLSEEIAHKDNQIAKFEEEVVHATERKSQELRKDFTGELQEQLQETEEKMTRRYQLEMVRVRKNVQRGRVYLVITVIALLVAMVGILFSDSRVFHREIRTGSEHLRQEINVLRDENVDIKLEIDLLKNNRILKMETSAFQFALANQSNAATNEQATILKQEISLLRKEMVSEAQLRQEVDKLKQSITTIQGETVEMEQEIELLQSKQEGAMPKIEGAALKQVVDQLRQSLAATEGKTEELKQQVHLLGKIQEDRSQLETESAALKQEINKLKKNDAVATKVTAELKEEINLLKTEIASNMHRPIKPIFEPPPDILMTGFKEHKTEDYWLSPPFYSHSGGYKMLFNVVANGWGVCKGMYVSVYVYLMQGEHDDYLKWPFRGTITIQLLNQKRDEEHLEKTISYDDASGDLYAGRVVGQERAYGGLGSCDFIAHTGLNTKNKQYLKNDSLKFRILGITVRSI